MTEQRDIFKKALIKAMSEKYEEELSAADNESKIICSTRHYKKLSDIFGFNVANGRRTSKRLLVGILVAALLLTGCTVYAYRDEIKGFFIEIYETYIRVTYDTDSNSTMGADALTPYQAAYVPDGYKLVDQSSSPLHAAYEWRDSNGNIMCIQQKVFDTTEFYFDAEHGTTEIINYEQYKVYCRKFDDSYYYIWNDGDYTFTLMSTVDFSNDELFKIIKEFS